MRKDFPGSCYDTQVQQKLDECHNWLSQMHLFVGQFYCRRGAYLAAAHRFEQIINRSSNAYANEEFGKREGIAMHEPMIGVWGLAGYVFMVAVLAVGIVAFVLWVKSWLEQGRSKPTSCEQESDVATLRELYARREISKEEFEARCRDLL